ncbi:hypothetical protein KDA_77120 [Dictyobacter alpinus]|uniref:Uncharacterized protein n=1 Tax=Dictyobacter alpinus TaxID=2014873 RepID=A0A402BLI4_9CHLR|nr:hypothetical protein [Dictyobacter alpinus]GCE32228.1 hypothetical protein KDA_77120 [Dictyobacter alpinus]
MSTVTITATDRMQTLAKSYQEILQGTGGTPWVPLGNFMLDFFRNFPEQEQRATLIAEPIQTAGESQQEQSTEAHKWAVFCAASAEHLARRYGLAIPSWVDEPTYSPLEEPWYFLPMSYKKERVRLREEAATPPEFAKRNIYCGNVYIDKYAAAQEFKLRKTA